ncbi:hypothetical protein CDD81_2202 [Ophiocordyceps australis]|uniref:Peptidase M3A/M3B catalytic domain-containing protein n=1 Tax=Ophiocordyceps australis TaxID=1399860 RepID=A0A2C5XET6_9HYPO|nr:hypothetical protein CDD81_2202 [Ophiocordyceps australis]
MADYRNPPQPPPVFTTTAPSIQDQTSRLNDRTNAVYDSIVAHVKPHEAVFANVLQPMLIDDNDSAAPRRISTFYQHVSTDAALRQASNKAEQAYDDFYIEIKMREDMFKLVDAAFKTRADQDLEPEALLVIEKEHQKYVRNGLLLPAGPQRDRFKEIQKRLSQLCIQCQKNLNEEKSSIWFTRAQLEGVPSDDIDLDQLEQGTGENEGKVKLSFKYNHFFPLMKYAVHEDTRRSYIIADANKNEANVPLFHEIIELRDEAARMLGYDNHASLRIEQKMAKSTERVNSFLGDLRKRLSPGGANEIEHLLEYKQRDCEARNAPFDGSIYMWDVSFYSRLVKEKEYNVDETEISQYFPVQPTFSEMLKIFEELLGLVFVELKAEDRARLSPTNKAEDIVWHEDVVVYSVWDEEKAGGGFCGYLYLDLHPRDNKYGHNANFNLEPGYLYKDGSRHYPATALVCNFSKPSPHKPALLKHHEVVTLFHELGHGIHDLVARTRYSYFHGTSVVDDFVEAPSQMLENWCWTPSVLKRLSHRWDSGESLPHDMVDRLVKTKHFNSATSTLTQLLYGLFDMAIHTPKTHEDIKKMRVGQLWNQLRHEISGVKGPEDQGLGFEWGNRYANIGHYIGGYDAGYYGYLWSEVFSTDMFHSFFKKDPMNGKEGRRYRKTVLQYGGSRDEMQSLREFLGREPSTDAFYKELGLD